MPATPSATIRIRSAISWMLWTLATVLAAIAVGPFLPPPFGFTLPDLAWYLLYPALSFLQAIAFIVAAQRKALGPQLRQALLLTGMAFALSVVAGIGDLVRGTGWQWIMTPSFGWVVTFGTYLLGLAGILRMPMQRMAKGGLLLFVLDVAISVLGLGSLVTVLITLPQLQQGRDWGGYITYGAAQGLMLIGLNVLIVRGVARPSARAFWLFVGSLLLNLLAAALWQLQTVTEWVDATVLAKGMLLLWAGAAYALDPIAPGEPSPTPRWMNSFNPLPMAATFGLLGLLVLAAVRRDLGILSALAVTIGVQVALLVARLFLTARDNARLVAEQAARERQVHEAKMQAVGRLAGGIAHWFNNLLTTVIGHAELGVASAAREDAVEDFARIRSAADRAAQLTRQLLAFSGQEHVWPADVDVAGFVTSLAQALRAGLPAHVKLIAIADVPIGDGRACVRADRRLLEAVFHELIHNAMEAMPSGGTIVLRVGVTTVDEPNADAVLPTASGPHVTVDVEDTGVGMTGSVRQSMFDPFFTTKPVHAAAGLGLAAVYGIVGAHRGGIEVESEPGRGTRVRVLLPHAGQECRGASRGAPASHHPLHVFH